MATVGNERELLAKGLEQDGIVRGVWAQNLLLAKGAISARSGWGVEAELDTTISNDIIYSSSSFPADTFTKNIAYGYEKHFGSALVETSFGTKQVLSVFRAVVNYGDLGGVNNVDSYAKMFVVRIFDLTTRQSWEEPLYRQTSELISAGFPLKGYNPLYSYPSTWYGCYESSQLTDNTSFVSGDDDSGWYFHVHRNKVYFGSPVAGIFVYRPVDIQGTRSQQVETRCLFPWIKGYSETGCITPIHFMNGIFEQGFVYATESNISKVVAMTSFRGRIAYATDYSIFFSDINRPNNVIGINFINIPSKNKVTALYEFNGNLMIFTSKETFIYIPSEGTIVSQGRPPIKISESIGCIGQSGITLADNQLFWVSESGVFSSSSGRDTKEISEPIRAFWGGHGIMTNPMTSYFETTKSGFADINDATPPRTLIQFDPDQVSLAYNHDKRALIMGCPNLNGCWAFTGIWSWWPSESVVTQDGTGTPLVGCSKNLNRPWVLADNDDIYSVFFGEDLAGANEIQDNTTAIIGRSDNTLPSAEVPPSVAFSRKSNGRNYLICRLGKGGALDRSSYREDYRKGSGKYLPLILPDSLYANGSFVLGRPYYEEDTSTGVWRYWVPVKLVQPVLAQAIEEYTLHFKYDNVRWDAEPTGTAMTLRVPTERKASASGITGTIVDAAGNPDAAGSYIKVVFDGAAAPGAWTHKPKINTVIDRESPLFEFSMKMLTPDKSRVGFGLSDVKTSEIKTSAATVSNVGILVWLESFIGTEDSHNDNAMVQAVDWAYKGNEQGDGSFQIKARGIYAKMGSHGRGLQANRIVPNWVWGLYNVILGSDAKEYTSQIVDYDNDIQKIENKTTIRSRFRDVNGAMQKRVFGSSATDTPQWGSRGDDTAGNYLIDDEQTDTIATSDSVKGGSISYMVFGFIQDRAESLGLLSLVGVFRPGGRRRRTGR